MTTLPTLTTSTISSEQEISPRKLGYFRSRLRHRVHQTIIREFHRNAAEGRTTKAAFAKRLGRGPDQISRWLGAPGNWTLNTVSDLLLGLELELHLSVQTLNPKGKRNFDADAVLYQLRSQSSEPNSNQDRHASLPELVGRGKNLDRQVSGRPANNPLSSLISA